MKKSYIILFLMAFLSALSFAQVRFSHQGESLTSAEHRLYVNAEKKTNVKHFTFRTVNEALRFAERYASDTITTDIYIEPSVYWIDDPDDPNVRKATNGGTPFGLEVTLSHTRLIGLSENPEDVVLACNRGQTQGAEGNFTMLHITGSRNEAYNITFGNYCNVDLSYPRNPKLNRPRRKDAIVQAQLVICSGDDYKIENCRFISRLNLCPFVGCDHVDFYHCYFECTDDALSGTAVYRQCQFTLYSSKPFYSTYKHGATFIDCDLHSKVRGTQYLTKVSGPVRMERCRWTSDDPELKIAWNKRPDPTHYCVMTDCTLNGKPLDVPTPTEPLPVALPPVCVANQPDIVPGQWTIDCHKPLDTEAYNWQADNSQSAWGYAEGIDGGEGSWGLVQLLRGARLMFTPTNEEQPVKQQTCIITLDPCKAPGQGFGSATGQYLDLCIKFDTRSLTGYGLRLIRTPEYDRAVEAYLVEYANGNVSAISLPERCDLFRPGCQIELKAKDEQLTVKISNDRHPELPSQILSAKMPHPNTFGGFHLQHTGTTGASATVVKSIFLQ